MSSRDIGGVAENSNKGNINKCYNTGGVLGETAVGGVVGSNYTSTCVVQNCYYLESTADAGIGEDDNGHHNENGYRRPESDFTSPQVREGLVYDRTEQELITEVSAEGGTMVYRLSENENYSDDIPVGTDAGEYIVW